MGKEIAIRDLTFSYSGRGDQISHVTLDIRAGEVIVLTGPSGSGKSSLTRVINGLIPYFYEGELSGQIRVGDKPLEEIHSWERGKLVGNVFQDPRSQFFANEVAGEIAFGCENYGYTHEEIQSHVLQAAQYNKIEDLLDHSLHTLSYGMRQKVAIASAQAIEPEIYVMDEPSANLDIESTYRFGDIIRNLKAQGKTIVIAEHRLYYLMDVADRFFCIQHGAIVREFSREEMKSLPSAEVHTLGLRTPDLYQMAFQQMPSAATDEVVLETQGLHKAFDGTVVAEHLDFVCHRGEIVADGLFCREIDGLFCRSSPDIIVRRRCVLSHKRRGWLQPSPSFRYSRNLALQDELYHPVINNGPAVLVCVDKRLGTGPVNQSRDAG